MAVYGADSEQLRSLSKTVSQAADHLSQVGSQVNSQLGSTRWMGPDGDRSRSQWNSSSMASLRAAAQELRTAAAALQRNAQEQDQTSAATGGANGLGAIAEVAGPFDMSQIPHGAPQVTEGSIYDAAGLAMSAKGILDDSKTLHDSLNGLNDIAQVGPGSDVLGAAGVALDAQDLGKRWQGIEDGNIGDFLGGLLDVGGAAVSVGGMVAPEAAVPLAGFDLGITGLSAGLDDTDKGK